MMVEPVISFDEVLRDSPNFRQCLQENEGNIEDFEAKIERVVKACMQMVDHGRLYNNSMKSFFDSLDELRRHFDKHEEIKNWIKTLIKIGRDLTDFGAILVDHGEKSFAKTLVTFVKDDVKKLKESRNAFAKISSDLDGSLQRHAQLPKTKCTDLEETGKLLTANRSCFQHTALDYVEKMSKVQTAKKHIVMDSILGQMQALRAYHSQALKTFSEHEAQLEDAAQHSIEMRTGYDRRCKALSKELDNYLQQVSGEPHCPVEHLKGAGLEGYLFKRTTNAFKTWNRRWFVLDHGSLSYRKRDADSKEITVMEQDLRLCTVRELADGERRFTFEVLSPQKSHTLQADSDKSLKIWINALREGINDAHQNQNELHVRKMPPWTSQATTIGNEKCVDCGAAKPEWASVNLGASLCIQCSGIHRSLGVHISKVRSLKLDSWEDETIKIMERIGNVAVNEIFAANVDDSVEPAKGDSERSVRESWIRAKYLDKAFVKPLPTDSQLAQWTVARKGFSRSSSSSSLIVFENEQTESTSSCDSQSSINLPTFPVSDLNPSRLLYEAAGADNLKVMLHAIALGADVNYRCEAEQLRTPLHKAIADGPWVTSAEFLLLNGAQHTTVDLDGKTPLHLASQASSVSLVGLLLKRGADRDAVDKDGNSALALAVANGNAEIVTLIRLDKFREDLRLEDSDFTSGDDVFDQVMRDFSTKPEEGSAKTSGT